MNTKEAFKIWAPTDGKWSPWVRPVPFVENKKAIGDELKNDFKYVKINYANEIGKDTAVFLDLPSDNAIYEGLELAKCGFVPVPIYNGTDEQENSIATLNNDEIKASLIKGAEELTKINVDKNAAPVFLLDTNRMNRWKMNPSIFDNSWDLYYQDIPSAEYFLKNKINKIVVRSEKIQKDLKVILYEFQKKGIEIFHMNMDDEIRRVKLKNKIFRM